MVLAASCSRSAACTKGGELLLFGSEDGVAGSMFDATIQAAPTPMPLPCGVHICGVSMAVSSVLAISTDGRTFSFGDGNHGRLGHGDASDQHVLREIDALHGLRVCEVAAGKNHSLALCSNGAVYSWGSGQEGCLGHGEHGGPNHYIPKLLSGLQGMYVQAVAAGEKHSMAIAANGSVYAWGCHEHGVLAQGEEQGLNVHSPYLIEGLQRAEISAVSAGRIHNLALSVAGVVYSWGDGDEGKLGHGTEQSLFSPTVIQSLKTVRICGIEAGADHSMALAEDGAVYSWGCGRLGRLGHGDQLRQLYPRTVSALQSIRISYIAAGSMHSLALSSDGSVYIWGCSESDEHHDEPIPIPNLRL
eukprot:gnl/TRDRNA2_/TRDRNA2_87937_c0_seq2.p1 gnl/TRDRNA2_/TRDRNA2_87937_c0~~gnl/TRDRNA2_/TRDRNA2_87937_c0_seq2.p1  ORF type:complete len:359 (-),score=23.74 gnl/TRDRNA2_/TRDRNA2_87937_c0_seq2:53-1129(-)